MDLQFKLLQLEHQETAIQNELIICEHDNLHYEPIFNS